MRWKRQHQDTSTVSFSEILTEQPKPVPKQTQMNWLVYKLIENSDDYQSQLSRRTLEAENWNQWIFSWLQLWYISRFYITTKKIFCFRLLFGQKKSILGNSYWEYKNIKLNQQFIKTMQTSGHPNLEGRLPNRYESVRSQEYKPLSDKKEEQHILYLLRKNRTGEVKKKAAVEERKTT